MREDFLEFKKYYREAAVKLPRDSFFRQSIDHKFKHSISVLHTGERIIDGVPELKSEPDNFQNIARTALLFHDVGRFEEAVKRYKTPHLKADARILNQYDHGLIGYQKMKSNPLYNDIRILLAVRYHGKMMEEVKQSPLWTDARNSCYAEEAEKILYLVRDADKLALLKDIRDGDQLRKDIFFKLLPEEALKAGISEKVKQQFFAGQTVLSSTIFSFADRILLVISWIFDLNYPKTRKIFKQEKYDHYLLELLAQYHSSSADIDQITDCVFQNL